MPSRYYSVAAYIPRATRPEVLSCTPYTAAAAVLLPLAMMLVLCGTVWAADTPGVSTPASPAGPYELQVSQNLQKLADKSPAVRVRSAEALGFLRAYVAEEPLIALLADSSALVRRQAAMSLAWCGGRKAIPSLLQALNDDDWLVRQGAWVSLTNLTGMEFAFDSLAAAPERAKQVEAWKTWCLAIPADQTPKDVLALLQGGSANFALGATVTASTTYRGPLEVLTDGQMGPKYWQTKNVAPPQWCQIDLGVPKDVSRVVVHQYGPGYCMMAYELSVSTDGATFETVASSKELTPVELAIEFPARKARYVRITSLGSQNKAYPTTFYEVEVFAGGADSASAGSLYWRQERGVRALGVLGGKGATEAVLAVLGKHPLTTPANRPTVRTAIRSLARLHEEAGFAALVELLDDPFWARNAADALGDFGDRRAVPGLLKAYPRYAKHLDGKDPNDVPPDDRMKFPSQDRMLETPFDIAYALCRLPLDAPEDRAALRKIAPQIMANVPGDYDTFVLYQPEASHLLTRHLMECSGLRQEAVEQAMESLGQPRRVAAAPDSGPWPKLPPRRMATWLPSVCTDKADLPRLLALLGHEDGWVRINAAKAIAWLGDRSAAATLASVLAKAPAEGDFVPTARFKDDEFNDVCPRWREAIVRALGMLGGPEHAPLLVKVLNDEKSALEIRHAAADALADLGTPDALAALRDAARRHPYQTIRHVAADALQVRGMVQDDAPAEASPPAAPTGAVMTWPDANFNSLVFVKGDNDLPNSKRTVEQADRWRQTYVVTDEGPVYRPGDNLFILSPPRPDGVVTPLTKFPGGYVAEPEVTWDGKTVLFTHRDANSPWWHVWRINADGSGLKQLTDGPYHDVGPVQLGDGRIVFASSRVGARDEYHGYLCTSLHVMNADGGDMHAIATNIGRDNEPALLPDGRIVFSRLEVFYSRNKTELTLHAARTDGTGDMVLYGPERRAFWRNLDHGPKAPDDGQESPMTHRVLRMTQPQPMPDGQSIVVSTQGGLTLIGPQRNTETLITPDYKTRAYTTPFPLADGSILCATTLKTPDRKKVDLGIYRFYPDTQRLELIYNDPNAADYEARPIVARQAPPMQSEQAARNDYSGRFFCASTLISQEADVRQRGRLVRLIEGVPMTARHSTHNPDNNRVWENHGGTHARVLGTAPLAADGSFFMEIPADRLVHLQVLDSDRRVMGNQLTWIYARPGETKSCVGCHEDPDTSAPGLRPQAAQFPPVKFLPSGGEFSYRAKAWMKGSLPPEVEEQTRTVRAVNLLGR